MKRIVYPIVLVSSFILIACDQSKKMPPAINSAVDARALLPGKRWAVKDVGLKVISLQESEPWSVEWFSAGGELGEYELKVKEKFSKATIELSRDTVANASNLDLAGAQTYVITDEEKEDTEPGVRLELTGASDAFKDLGISEATYTYRILGADEKGLLLEAPNEINNRKVILWLVVN